ncbi:hypothetical protein [Streptomyces brasiliensis]|uniref:hypothetical protein n=1 Tax=Streptomyces brasiliensis TaxID=1954 RepID=UPI001670F6CF|nr:hypothetical protein [Streptomyces brasiliensis]
MVQGTVDGAGPSVPEPGTTFREFASSDLAKGYLDLTIDTNAPRFVRVEVRSATGEAIALSNPVWLLRGDPAGGIPAGRQVR